MQKLLNRYRAKPTFDNAQKIYLYAQKHPMAACMLSSGDAALPVLAVHHASCNWED